MAMLEVAVFEGTLNSEIAVVTIKLVTCRDIDIVTGEGNTAQAAVGAAAFKVDFSRVPIDMLFTFLLHEINSEYTTVAFSLMAAPHNRRRNQLW